MQTANSVAVIGPGPVTWQLGRPLFVSYLYFVTSTTCKVSATPVEKTNYYNRPRYANVTSMAKERHSCLPCARVVS